VRDIVCLIHRNLLFSHMKHKFLFLGAAHRGTARFRKVPLDAAGRP
jgi:hypothetical protein